MIPQCKVYCLSIALFICGFAVGYLCCELKFLVALS
jgi:hypothetical protein